MTKPVILIATHDRYEITCKVVLCALAQKPKPEIVLVCSDNIELSRFKATFKDVHVILHPNRPLGLKWQSGMEYIQRNIDASCVIIQGSDDVLCKGFISSTERLINQGYDFVGIMQWYIFDPKETILYKFNYTPSHEDPFPLGGGRFYSRSMMDAINWTIFDTSRNSCLDDLGWNKAKEFKHLILKEPASEAMQVLAVKGNWKVMNPLNITLNHPNAKLIEKKDGIKALNYIKKEFNFVP